ncbi:MAG: radical SAM protein [Candidatus Woesearchaeota archaeon]|jgi:hypothetical protein
MEYIELKEYNFLERKDEETSQEFVRVIFKKYYYFDIPKQEISELSENELDIKSNKIGFKNVDKIEKKFYNLLDKYQRNNLTHALNQKSTIFIDKDSGIPLIGTNEFGIIDRNTSILEIKPLTGCNYSCIFCSVDEGKNKKSYDYLVDCDYLIEEVEKVASLKRHPVEINIGPQGEPLLYPDIIQLIKKLKEIKNIYFVSMNSNGSVLTKELIDELKEAGLGRLNLSLNAIDEDVEEKLICTKTNIKKILEMAEYAKDKFQVMLAPVLIPTLNENQVDKLIEVALKLKKIFPHIGIQNYLEYKGGRTPVKEWSFDKFYAFLKKYEEKHGIRLKLAPEDFNIFPDKTLDKPFEKDATIKAQIKCHGRKKNEVIAVAEGRCITIKGSHLDKGHVRVKIVRDKHNIFNGILI